MRKIAMTAVLLLLPSCAAQYEERVALVGGYSSLKVSPGRYVVAVDTNWFNDVGDAVFFAYAQAQALCESAGLRKFDVESDRRPGNDAILVVTCTNDRAPVVRRGEH